MPLQTPSFVYEDDYKSYIQELGDEERYPFPLDFDHSDFLAMLSRIEDFSLGRNLPEGYVPSTTYWLIEEGSLVGVSNLRHYLSDGLHEAGGHIGLGVRPSCREKGVGQRLLRLTLDKARDKGIHEVHIHCYDDNKASSSLIMSCGGQLHSTVNLQEHVVLRYIINL